MTDSIVLTLDVEEDYEGLETGAGASSPEVPDRLPDLIPRWLDILDAHGARATFFVLGRVAERHPGLVTMILKAGHEVGSHGYRHRKYSGRDRSAVRRDVVHSRKALRAAGAKDPVGFRAPAFSVAPEEMAWFSRMLARHQFRYDSSLIGPGHPVLGHRSVSNRPETIGPIREIPVPTQSLGWFGLPVGGGVTFRLLPYRLTRWLLNRYLTTGPAPPVLYFHPWELASGRPELRSPASWRAKFGHFWGRRGFENKLGRLLEHFDTIPMEDYVRQRWGPPEG